MECASEQGVERSTTGSKRMWEGGEGVGGALNVSHIRNNGSGDGNG